MLNSESPPSDSSQKPSTQLKQKTTIDLPEKIVEFFYYQSHIICKGVRKVFIFNTLTKSMNSVPSEKQEFIVEFMPPFLFALIEGQFLTLYEEDLTKGSKKIKISKLEPLTICKFNKGYIMGGYNKSSLPGNKRTTRRLIYLIDKLDFEQKNVPDSTIKIKDSECPISKLTVQNPYLFVYCRPTYYLISLHSKDTLITFEKDSLSCLILQGRYAFSAMNGIGLSLKNTIFTFDVERYPLYGVEVNEHIYTAQCLCREKTGRIFGGHGNMVFEYNPIKKYSKCWALYPEGEIVTGIGCTPSNSLMALRINRQGKYSIDVFGLD